MHEESHTVSNETFSKMHTKMKASYKGLFHHANVSGKVSRESHRKEMSAMAKSLTFSFSVRKVLIHRPWLEVGILKYPTIGIRGLKAGGWSSGELDANEGQFPVLPTAMVVAKDIVLKVEESAKSSLETLYHLSSSGSASVVSLLHTYV